MPHPTSPSNCQRAQRASLRAMRVRRRAQLRAPASSVLAWPSQDVDGGAEAFPAPVPVEVDAAVAAEHVVREAWTSWPVPLGVAAGRGVADSMDSVEPVLVRPGRGREA